MDICVWSLAHEIEMRGDLVYLVDLISLQPQYIILDSLIVEFFGGVFKKHFARGLWIVSFIGII